MHRFYCNIKESGGVLDGDEAYHAINVLRIKENDSVICFDGKGFEWNCKVINVVLDKRNPKVIVNIISENYLPSKEELIKPKLNLICSIFKLDRFEWGLEKITEIGIDEIIITKTKYSQYDLSIAEKKLPRWKEILISASKQSNRVWIPEISISSYGDLLKEDSKSVNLVATTEIKETKGLKEYIKENVSKYNIWIGPEGGFESMELSEILKFYKPLSLGKNILRAETAMIVSATKLVEII